VDKEKTNFHLHLDLTQDESVCILVVWLDELLQQYNRNQHVGNPPEKNIIISKMSIDYCYLITAPALPRVVPRQQKCTSAP